MFFLEILYNTTEIWYRYGKNDDVLESVYLMYLEFNNGVFLGASMLNFQESYKVGPYDRYK